jgi:Ca2+-binding EF-hand superfamily protein
MVLMPRANAFQAKQAMLGSVRNHEGHSMNLAQGTQIDVVVQALREKLEQQAGVMQAFHDLDTDNSNQLSVDEFAEVLKKIGFKLPRRQLEAVIARCTHIATSRTLDLALPRTPYTHCTVHLHRC